MKPAPTYEQLLEQSRQRLATRMLQETDMPVSEIASMLGYAAQGNFTRAFAHWFGRSPSAWRKMPPTNAGRKEFAGRPAGERGKGQRNGPVATAEG